VFPCISCPRYLFFFFASPTEKETKRKAILSQMLRWFKRALLCYRTALIIGMGLVFSPIPNAIVLS
jgi:hypothetical protein